MRVSIATQAAIPGPGRPNEDYAVASTTLAVLLDGAPIPPTRAEPPCPHGARWFTRALGSALFAELSAEPPVWIAEAVAKAIDAVATIHATTCAIDDQTHPAATIAIIRQLPDVYEYYVLGDSTIVFDLAGGQVAARTDKRLAHLPRPTARNVRGGYWIASTNPDAAARGRQGHVPRKEVRRAALLTDGAAAIVERYDRMDWRSALDLIERRGPQAIIQATREAEDADPEAARRPPARPHDDATAVFCLPD